MSTSERRDRPAAVRRFADADTGRSVRQLTAGGANHYPLYYFVPSHSADGRWMVVHSEATGWVQLCRLDLDSGEMVQLTEGRTRESGWAIWCEPQLRGIYNHLSSLNRARGEVWYFQDEADSRAGTMQLRAVDVSTGADRLVLSMPGRMSVGQSAFSPDGRLFAFIHADHDAFRRAISDRMGMEGMGRRVDHEAWRRTVGTTITVVDVASGAAWTAAALAYHVHHVLFVDARTLLVNHCEDGNGMWVMDVEGGEATVLRPANERGRVCHQTVTASGVWYEAFRDGEWDGRTVVGLWRRRSEGGRGSAGAGGSESVGGSDVGSVGDGGWSGEAEGVDGLGAWREFDLALPGYAHTAMDPRGRSLFMEVDGEAHELVYVRGPWDASKRALVRVRLLAKAPARGQRYHAHPFLAATGDDGHDRRWLYHTAVIDGYSQVCAVDVSDLTAE